MPRIEPTDRAIHGADLDAAEPAPPAIEPQPAAPLVRAAPGSARLARDDLRKLHAVLHELAECRKLIESRGGARRIGRGTAGIVRKIEPYGAWRGTKACVEYRVPVRPGG